MLYHQVYSVVAAGPQLLNDQHLHHIKQAIIQFIIQQGCLRQLSIISFRSQELNSDDYQPTTENC